MNQSMIRGTADRKRPVVVLNEETDAFVMVARARNAMRAAGWSQAEIAQATDAMMYGDEVHLYDVVCALCEVV